jgi:hypothetical protein
MNTTVAQVLLGAGSRPVSDMQVFNASMWENRQSYMVVGAALCRGLKIEALTVREDTHGYNSSKYRCH